MEGKGGVRAWQWLFYVSFGFTLEGAVSDARTWSSAETRAELQPI